ncbi:MAG: hypothetical protein AAGJ79_08860 [Verrucomicrobiota bacterium]
MPYEFFKPVDWIVIFGYLLLTTWVGHALRGSQATIRDFFLGGRSLPWPAVSGSIIATEISGVTFIGVPGTLFALHGDFTYLQWAIGSIIARVIVAKFIVRVYYEREIYSPYDYMGLRLGLSAKTLATVIFTIGSILAQSVRVLVAAIPLKIVTGMPLWCCIMIIGIFAIGWTLMGGMRTVIWTDVMQFVLFAVGGTVALVWLVSGIDGGWFGMLETAKEFGRTRVFNTELQADLQFTLWVALFAVPFQNLGIFGVDQLAAQRMFCCKDARAAGKAILFSSFGQLITLLMLLIGAALFVNYHQTPFTDAELATVFDTRIENADAVREVAARAEHPQTGATSKVLAPRTTKLASGEVLTNASADYVFPMWIVLALPVGLSGLIIAGVFAAAISSLDSILAALSQTTLSLIYHPERGNVGLTEKQLMTRSHLLVVGWGITLTLFTLLLAQVREDIPIIPLAFGMTSYTVGPLLALFVCAMAGRGSVKGLLIGFILSFLLVMFVRTDIWVLLLKAGWVSPEFLAALPTYALNATKTGITSAFSYTWMWPITFVITFAFGALFAGPPSRKND